MNSRSPLQAALALLPLLFLFLLLLLPLLLLPPHILRAQDAAPLPAKGGRGVSLDEILTALDANRDDKVARDEATGTFAQQRFTQWDADGVGFGGPDIYPHDPVLTHPQRGVYRLYAPLAGIVPLGTAVQQNNYTQKASFRGPAGETPLEEIYAFGRDQLHLNHMFWGTRPGYFEKAQAMMASPSFPKDPAGGLSTALPE